MNHKFRLGNVMRKVVIAGGLVICLSTLLRFLATEWWITEILSSFAVQYAVLMTPLVLACCFWRNWKWAVLFFVVLCINGFIILDYLPLRQTHSPDLNSNQEPPFRLMIQNVQVNNTAFDRLRDLVNEEQPTVILLLETNENWIRALEQLHDYYPWHKHDPHQGAFGLSILSKKPWNSCEILHLGPHGLPTVLAKWGSQESQLTLVGVHPYPPISAAKTRSRNLQLIDSLLLLEGVSQQYEGTKIVAGDFNMTPWSPWFEKLLVDPYQAFGGYRLPDSLSAISIPFRDAAKDFNLDPTWQLFPTLLGGVKIDQVLIHSHEDVLDYRVGPNVGSDHRAVFVDLAQ